MGPSGPILFTGKDPPYTRYTLSPADANGLRSSIWPCALAGDEGPGYLQVPWVLLPGQHM